MSSHCEVYESYERQTRATYDAVSNRASSSSLGGGHHRRQPQRFGNPAVGHKAQDAGAVHKIINLLGLTGGRHSYEDSNAYEDYDTVSQNYSLLDNAPKGERYPKKNDKTYILDPILAVFGGRDIHKLHYFFYFFQNGIRVHESPDTNVNKGKNSNFFKHLDQAKPIQTPIQGGGGGGGASIIFRVS